jgi:isocitrate/isopropylmalate dehydrogenase
MDFKDILFSNINFILVNMNKMCDVYEVDSHNRTNMITSSIILHCLPSKVTSEYINQLIHDKEFIELSKKANSLDIDLKAILISVSEFFKNYPDIEFNNFINDSQFMQLSSVKS